MPEPAENPAAEPTKPTKRKRAAAPEKRLADLKKKYRLEDTVKIVRVLGHDGKPLGVGPLLDPQVFAKFAELDTTPEKRYLDWMLYQAGGGPEAVKVSLETWGQNQEPLDPGKVINDWKQASRSVARFAAEDVNYVVKNTPSAASIARIAAQLINAGAGKDDAALYQALVGVLTETKVVPGAEDRVAKDLVAYRLKKYVRGRSDVKARDRIHSLITYTKLFKQESLEEFETEWAGGFELKKKREYVLGDEDSVNLGRFGFARHWPGQDSKYEKIYNTMKQFLINKARVEERAAKLDQWNAQIKAKNAELKLAQGDEIPLREPLSVELDIGTVTLTKDLVLVYKGKFQKISDLAKVNNQIENLPFRERVQSDVRYAGLKGKIGRSEKLYSDANLDVLVPLTVMAAIKGGHPSWDISDPEQLSDLDIESHHSGSSWQRTHEVGHRDGGAVSLFFIFKQPDVPEAYQRLKLTISLGDLISIEPNELGAFVASTKWHGTSTGGGTTDFKTIVADMRSRMSPETYRATLSSISKALRTLRDWSKEFDPRSMVTDFVTYHRDKMRGRRGLREMIRFRALQVVDRLINE